MSEITLSQLNVPCSSFAIIVTEDVREHGVAVYETFKFAEMYGGAEMIVNDDGVRVHITNLDFETLAYIKPEPSQRLHETWSGEFTFQVLWWHGMCVMVEQEQVETARRMLGLESNNVDAH